MGGFIDEQLPKKTNKGVEALIKFINTLYPHQDSRKQRFSDQFELTHALLGLAGETGEVVDLIKKNLAYGKPLDKTKLTLEMGDLLHYFLRVAELTDISFDDIVENNETKLRARYPNGYTNEDAINQTEKSGGK